MKNWKSFFCHFFFSLAISAWADSLSLNLALIFSFTVISNVIHPHVIHCFLFYVPPFSMSPTKLACLCSASCSTLLTHSIFHLLSFHILVFFIPLFHMRKVSGNASAIDPAVYWIVAALLPWNHYSKIPSNCGPSLPCKLRFTTP